MKRHPNPSKSIQIPPKVPPESHLSTAIMGKLSANTCESAKLGKCANDRLLGDGDGLFLRIRLHGTKSWVVEYEFQAFRRKPTLGVFDAKGAPGLSISAWLQNGWLSLRTVGPAAR